MNFLKRCWRLHFGWKLCILLGFMLLFWVWVDWSGARRFRAAEAMIVKEGGTLDFRALAPDPIPDAENFCAIPLLKDLSLVVDGDENEGTPGQNRARLIAMDRARLGKTTGRSIIAGACLGQRTDLRAWSASLHQDRREPAVVDSENAARNVLGVLAEQDAVFEELAAGLNRAGSQWMPSWKTRELPPNLNAIRLPHLNLSSGLIRTLTLRAIAAARAGDASKAQESLQVIARLSEACMGEPFLLGLDTGTRGASGLANATWELCDARIGTAEDYARLESTLARMDFRRATLLGVSSELIAKANYLRDLASKTPEQRFAMFQEVNNGRPGSFMRAFDIVISRLPSGFFDANAAVLADREFTYGVKPIRDLGWQGALTSARDFDQELSKMKQRELLHPSQIVACIDGPVIPEAIYSSIYAQTLVNQATIACALERYRIENGSYPESLDDVKLADGRPLPLDIMTGKSAGYRKTPNEKYALWSVAFNGKDHGGRRLLDERTLSTAHPEIHFRHEDYAGDWVWDFPEK